MHIRTRMFGVFSALLLTCFTVMPLAAGGSQEESQKGTNGKSTTSEESSDSETQKSDSQTQKSEKNGSGEAGSSDSSEGNASLQDEGPAAVVNGTEIPMKRLNEMVNYLRYQYMQQGQQISGDQLKQVRDRSLDLLIDQEVLYQVAKESGYEAKEENVEAEVEKIRKQSGGEQKFREGLEKRNMTVEDLKTDMRKRLVWQKYLEEEFESNVSVSDEEAKNFYDNNQGQFTQKEQVKASHIIIRVKEDASQEKIDEARQKIETVEEKLENGEEFEKLARNHSEGPSSEEGGLLGYVQRGQMVKSFEETAFSLDPGEVSDIIRTRFGFHIVKVTDRKEKKVSPYKEVKTDIVDHLKTSKMDEKVQALLDKKKKNMDISKPALDQ